ncbi:putative gustatory receptor 28b isoform X3 [Eupeodes corollae]|uniref:putative gustatory receptor 28b isoform X3 n=1 Tax=Eupeodes corollae TaxID=290404 RepID=UPI00249115A1|nr:putative gustatory receptor 28b isoform X3 [Eupeodes corollae]
MCSAFWKELFSPTDSYGSIKTLFIILFVMGLTPFLIKGTPGKRQIRVSYFGFLNAGIHLTLFMFCFLYAFVKNESIVAYFFQTEISRIGNTLQTFIGMFGMVTLIGMSLIEKKKIIRLLHTMAKVDVKLLDLGVSLNYRYAQRHVHAQIVAVLGLNLLYILSSFGLLFKNGIWSSLAANVSFFSPHVFLLAVVTLFTACMVRLKQRFRMVNKVLKNLSNQWENRKIRSISAKSRSLNCLDSFSMYTIVTKNPCEIIHESMEIHHLICEAASTANKYFTYQLLTIISIAFLIIVFDAYYVLETLLGKSKRESKFKTVEFVTFFSCQMILYLIAIISIVEGSNRAIKKSEQTGGIVHGLLNKAKSPDVKEKLQQFSMQLMHLKINFTAAGLFNIDRTLYFTISGALTTYLIILLQFTSSAPNGSVPCSFGQNGNITAIGNATIAPNN